MRNPHSSTFFRATTVVLLVLLRSHQCFAKSVSADRISKELVVKGDAGLTSPEEKQRLANNQSGVLAVNSSLTILTLNQMPSDKAFCVIKGACRLGDGSVILPKWMRAYSAHISNCGLRKLLYHLVEVPNEDSNLYYEVRGMTKQISLRDNFRDFDVIGNEAPRGERELLVNDLTPAIVLLDLLTRVDAYSKDTKSLCTTKNGVACAPEQGTEQRLKHMIVVDSRVSDTKDYMWPKGLLRLIRNSVSGNLEITDMKELYAWKVYSEASCFRSLISTNVDISKLPAKLLGPKNIFFSKNNLHKSTGQYGQQSNPCSVKVLILNRYGKRYIEGSEKLSEAIAAYGALVNQADERVSIQSEVVFFENSSFHEQVSVMQEAGVVVASHGDGNANFIFLRRKSRIFEILPFGFASDVYKNISRTYGSTHAFVWSQPDRDVFSSCVKHFNPNSSEEREIFLSRWQIAATHFTEETLRRKANILNEYTVPEEDKENPRALRRLRQCASYQRISVDVRHLAKMVANAAADMCEVKGNRGFPDTS